VHISTTIGVLGCHPSVAFYLGGGGGCPRRKYSTVQSRTIYVLNIELEIRRNNLRLALENVQRTDHPSCLVYHIGIYSGTKNVR
jgi:hypothetical protein